jgi:hypothetical protein
VPRWPLLSILHPDRVRPLYLSRWQERLGASACVANRLCVPLCCRQQPLRDHGRVARRQAVPGRAARAPTMLLRVVCPNKLYSHCCAQPRVYRGDERTLRGAWLDRHPQQTTAAAPCRSPRTRNAKRNSTSCCAYCPRPTFTRCHPPSRPPSRPASRLPPPFPPGHVVCCMPRVSVLVCCVRFDSIRPIRCRLQAVVFCNSRTWGPDVADALNAAGLAAVYLCGEHQQVGA